MPCSRVGHSNNSDGCWQAFQPVCQTLGGVLPRLRTHRVSTIHVAFVPLRAGNFQHSILTLLCPARVLIYRGAIKRKALNTFLAKMLKGRLYQCVIICCHIRNVRIISRVGVRATDPHYRHLGFLQGSLNFRIIVIGNNAVTAPFVQMLKTGHKIFFQI